MNNFLKTMTIVPENKLRPWIDKISFELMDLGADEIDYKIVLSEGIHIALALYETGYSERDSAIMMCSYLAYRRKYIGVHGALSMPSEN